MKKILYTILAFALALSFNACKGYEHGNLELGGDCLVNKIVFNDSLAGQMDLENKAIKVILPEVYSADSMRITALELSEGASCNYAVGTTICLREPRVIKVQNGSASLSWTITAKNEAANIISFKVNDIYTGIINQSAKTIALYLPAAVDITKLVTNIEISDGATISPISGVATDFSSPVTYTVTNNSAKNIYVVTATQIDKPKALYVGLESTMSDLNIEEQTACLWMLANVPMSLYASIGDIKNNKVDLSECKAIWWHFHKDGGVDGGDSFDLYGAKAIEAIPALEVFYSNGGNLLLSRYATHLPALMHIWGADPTGRQPNNCWGQNEDEAETCGEPWSFLTEATDHYLYKGLAGFEDNGKGSYTVYTTDEGYRITNSTAQWHIGQDWGGYPDHAYFVKKLGATVLGHGGDNAITVWEFPAKDNYGTILCIGSGCYDWYSCDEKYGTYHQNVEIMTKNAFNHFMGE